MVIWCCVSLGVDIRWNCVLCASGYMESMLQFGEQPISHWGGGSGPERFTDFSVTESRDRALHSYHSQPCFISWRGIIASLLICSLIWTMRLWICDWNSSQSNLRILLEYHLLWKLSTFLIGLYGLLTSCQYRELIMLDWLWCWLCWLTSWTHGKSQCWRDL